MHTRACKRVRALLERWNPHACEIALTGPLYAYGKWHAPPAFDFEKAGVCTLILAKDIKGGSQQKAAV